jgi:predicted metal-dependent hydrolase
MTYLYPEQELKRRTMAWAVQLKVNPQNVRIVPMKEKWGSCTTSGEVTLAEDLAQMEERFQDYVIVHELLHLRARTHGRLFKALMSAHIPEWRDLENAVEETRGSSAPSRITKKRAT